MASTTTLPAVSDTVQSGPIDRDEIFEIVRDRLADILEIEPGGITEGLIDRLGIRGSIHARLAAVGGRSDIRSHAGGTTVTLEWESGDRW